MPAHNSKANRYQYDATKNNGVRSSSKRPSEGRDWAPLSGSRPKSSSRSRTQRKSTFGPTASSPMSWRRAGPHSLQTAAPTHSSRPCSAARHRLSRTSGRPASALSSIAASIRMPRPGRPSQVSWGTSSFKVPQSASKLGSTTLPNGRSAETQSERSLTQGN